MTSYSSARIATHFTRKLFIQFFANYYDTGARRMGKHQTSEKRGKTYDDHKAGSGCNRRQPIGNVKCARKREVEEKSDLLTRVFYYFSVM